MFHAENVVSLSTGGISYCPSQAGQQCEYQDHEEVSVFRGTFWCCSYYARQSLSTILESAYIMTGVFAFLYGNFFT